MSNLYRTAVDELGSAVSDIDDASVDAACRMIGEARHVCVYAGGREGLQIKGFAMRLFHMGRSVSVVGDMTTPHVGEGDVFLVVCGPGEISTSIALIGVAKQAGAKILVVTAQPSGRVPQMADLVVTIPAQTMADDQGASAVSVLPMGSMFEGALFILFEVMVLKLKTLLDVSPEAMRKRHTNME